MKLQIGQEFLVYGPYHYERAKVIKAEKGRYTLDNNMVIDRDLHPLVPTKMTVEPFDNYKWEFLVAKGELPKLIAKLASSKVSEDKVVKVHKKLVKLLDYIENNEA